MGVARDGRRALDAAAVVAGVAMASVGLALRLGIGGYAGARGAAACGVAMLAGAAVAWWRTSPTPALAVVFFLYLADLALPVAPTPVFPPLICQFSATVILGGRWIAHAILVLGFVVAIAVPVPGWNAPSLASATGLAGWLAVLAVGAEIVRVRRRARSARMQATVSEALARVEHARRREGDEPLAIARDLHDVLAHQLALITVQANAGLALLARDDRPGVERALKAVKDAGNSALGGSAFSARRTARQTRRSLPPRAGPTPRRGIRPREDPRRRAGSGAGADGTRQRIVTGCNDVHRLTNAGRVGRRRSRG